MRRLLIAAVLAFMYGLMAAPSAKANEAAHGFCEVGNVPVVTSGLNSTNVVQGSFPQCTITVFVHGGGLATITSDNSGTVLSNPFTAQTNGQWIFYANNGRYDIQLSGAGFPAPTTISDVLLCDGSVPSAGCGGGGGGGSGTVGPGTVNIIAKFTAPNAVGNSSGFDDGTNVVQWPNGLSIEARPLTEVWPNASGGTTAATLVKIVGGQAVSMSNSDDLNQVYGIAFQGAGTSGNVRVAVLGQTPCRFDNQTVLGDQVTLSTSAAPQCHDTGSPDLTNGVPSFAKVVTVNGGAGTLAIVDLQLPGQQAFIAPPSGTILVPFGVTPITLSYTVQASDANHDVDITGSASSQTVTLPQPGTNGTNAFVQSTANTAGCSSTTTCITPGITVTAGDMLYVFVSADGSTGGFSGVTDSVGDTFTQIGTTLVPQANFHQAVFWTPHSTGGVGLTVQVTTSATTSVLAIMLGEFTNVVSFDQQAGGVGNGGSVINSPSVNTTSPIELLVGSVEQQGGSPQNPGSGYLTMTNTIPWFFGYQQVGAIGSYTAGLAQTAGAAWSSQISTFVLNGSAPEFGNGFWIWIANHSNTTWTVAATSSNIIACDGSAGGSVSLLTGQENWFESDGTNWREECGQGGSGSGGSVTEVDTSAPLGGGPITTTGTITCATCVTSAAALTNHAIVLGAGLQASSVLASLGTTTTLLHGNAAGAPSFAAVTLTTDVTGTLPVGNGGSGAATFTAHGVLLGETTSPFGVTTAGTSGDPLLSGGAGSDPAFGALNLAGVGVTGVLPTTNLPFTYSGSTTELGTVSGALTNGHCVSIDASGNFVDSGTAGPCGTGSGGAVTSVALSMPSMPCTVTGSPVTISGTLTCTANTETAHFVWAGPTSGGAVAPTFRALVSSDIASLTLPFSGLTSATNTFGILTCGSGCTITTSGAGVNAATSAPFSGITAGSFTGGSLTIGTGGTLTPVGAGTITATNVTPAGTLNDCVKWGAGGALADFGATCSSGGGSSIIVNGGSALASPVNFVNGTATNGTTIIAQNLSGSQVSFIDSGTRTIAGGGTGQTTAAAAFNALSPLTTAGDLLTFAGGANVRLGIGTSGQCLTSTGAAAAWAACATGSITGSASVNSIPKMSTTTSITASAMTDNGTTVSTGSESLTTPLIHVTGIGPLIEQFVEGSCTGALAGNDVFCLGDSGTHTAQLSLNGGAFQPIARVLSATSASIGGGSLSNGTCASGTVTVTGAAATMAVVITPQTDPGAGFVWEGFVSGANTVTARVCNATGSTNTPTASLYNVRVTP